MTSLLNLAKKIVCSSVVILGLQVALVAPLRAQTPENAPDELKETLQKIEEAANAKDLTKLMEFYSPEFSNTDGLKYETLSQGLKSFWLRYPTVTYKTEIKSWQEVDNQLVAETLTTIQGKEIVDGRVINLNSEIGSRQFFQDKKLIRQEIISEKSQITSGDKVPTIEVILPETVKSGQEYNFDVILKEPLGSDVLLGAAIEEKAGGDLYIQPSKFDLDLLSSGGIFKIVKAPDTPDSRWLSAVLIQAEGINVVTQRVRVEK